MQQNLGFGGRIYEDLYYFTWRGVYLLLQTPVKEWAHCVCQGSGKPAELQEMRSISSSGLCFLPGFKAVL